MYTHDFLRPRVALVTGGAGAIGRAVCRALADCGATVIAADRVESSPESDDVIEQIRLDVTQSSQIQASIEDIVRRHGRLDILVNVAGTEIGRAHV